MHRSPQLQSVFEFPLLDQSANGGWRAGQESKHTQAAPPYSRLFTHTQKSTPRWLRHVSDVNSALNQTSCSTLICSIKRSGDACNWLVLHVFINWNVTRWGCGRLNWSWCIHQRGLLTQSKNLSWILYNLFKSNLCSLLVSRRAEYSWTEIPF